MLQRIRRWRARRADNLNGSVLLQIRFQEDIVPATRNEGGKRLYEGTCARVILLVNCIGSATGFTSWPPSYVNAPLQFSHASTYSRPTPPPLPDNAIATRSRGCARDQTSTHRPPMRRDRTTGSCVPKKKRKQNHLNRRKSIHPIFIFSRNRIWQERTFSSTSFVSFSSFLAQ